MWSSKWELAILISVLIVWTLGGFIIATIKFGWVPSAAALSFAALVYVVKKCIDWKEKRNENHYY